MIDIIRQEPGSTRADVEAELPERTNIAYHLTMLVVDGVIRRDMVRRRGSMTRVASYTYITEGSDPASRR